MEPIIAQAGVNLSEFGLFAAGMPIISPPSKDSGRRESFVQDWVTSVDSAFAAATPFGTKWQVIGVQRGSQSYSKTELCLTLDKPRFRAIWNAAFPQDTFSTVPGSQPVDFFEEVFHWAGTGAGAGTGRRGGTPALVSVSKPAGKAMPYHTDKDEREGERSDMVAYFVLGDPDKYNRLLLFASNSRAEALELARRVDDSDPPVQVSDDGARLDGARLDGNGMLRLQEIETPEELKSLVGDLNGKMYQMWVAGGDCVVFDASLAHGVLNIHTQHALAVQAQTRNLVTRETPSRTWKRGPHGRQIGRAHV